MRTLSLTLTPLLLLAALAGCSDDDSSTTDAATTEAATTEASTTESATTDAADAGATNTIVDIAIADGRFETLVGAVSRVDLVDTLSSDGPFTVFAPTDDAFTALGVNLDDLSDEALTEILLYHVIDAEVASEDVPAAANTVAGFTLLFDTSDGVRVNNANVIIEDIEADNGVIHVIDAVLTVPNIVDMAGIAGLTELAGAIGGAADIPAEGGDVAVADALQGEGPLTVFAPSDAAFDAISETVAGLTAEQVRDVLLYHVVSGDVRAADLPSVTNPVSTLLAGPGVTIDASAPSVEGACNGSASNIGPADIIVSNGVIHLIDQVLLPIGCE